MTNGGFLANPEQEPQEAPSEEAPFQPSPEAVPTPAPEGEEFDEVAKAERQALEQMIETKEEEPGFLEKAMEEDAPEAPAAPADDALAAAPEAPEAVQDEVLIEVEKILEEDLEPLYENMPPEAKEKFLKKGKEVSMQIANMVRAFKLKMDRAIVLIRAWLLTIPGVNKFFLEQEAKIKADKILDLEEAIRTDIENKV
jgi:hypothetical protein